MLANQPSRDLHVAYANIGGRRGVAGFVEVLLDDFFEGALGCENKVDRVAASSETSRVGRNVVGHRFDFPACVGSGDGETTLPHDWQVNDIVADITELVDRRPGFGEDVIDGVHLVGLALVDELEFKVVGADSNRARVPLGYDADPQPPQTSKGDAKAVVGGKTLGLDPIAFGVGNDENLTVGENAIYVEDEDFDVFRAGFSGHPLMIPWRAEEEFASARQDIERPSGLTPVTFNPDIAFAMMIPVPANPVGMGMRWLDVISGDPDVRMAIPTMVAFMPGPSRMLVRRWRYGFDGSRRWPNADHNLGLSNARGHEKHTSGSGKEFLHSAVSFTPD
jgi:hypothetical protein